MGHRPCLPDSLPVIGDSAWHQGPWFAFGHGHLGLTASAKTGKLIAEAMTGGVHGLAPYSFHRFSGSVRKEKVPIAYGTCCLVSCGLYLRGYTCFYIGGGTSGKRHAKTL